jgi:predicted nucleic acid-binding protein
VAAFEDTLDPTNSESAGRVPLLVLDTNVVLDWLHFGDPSCERLGRWIACREVRWIATSSMRQELQHVLLRRIPGRWRIDPIDVLGNWDRWVTRVEPNDRTSSETKLSAHPTSPSLRCADASDQKFIDLALAANASALLSRDRAVLRLAGRAAAYGLQIQTAADWRPQSG